MGGIIFPLADYDSEPNGLDDSMRKRRERLRELEASVSAALAAANAADAEHAIYGRRWTYQPATPKAIAVRMPNALLQRLNAAAEDALVSRSTMIRQIIADYLNSMEGQGIRFSGSLLSIDKVDGQSN